MSCSYYDFMREISADELYDRFMLYGLFSEKVPPIFDMAAFLAYCKVQNRAAFEDRRYPYVMYDSMRNTNVPRHIGIPTPMGHELLCRCLSDNWGHIVRHFRETTITQKHKISRIHIRKMRDTDALFEMNYKNWRADGTPEPDIFMGRKYMVSADISQCFPSIYTHAIPWALVGKTIAKQNSRNNSLWYNRIDHFSQRIKNGETHGILIGPHTSNVLSEIILCSVDQKLCDKWSYTRNIDDYCCYVKTREEADDFLVDINRELQVFGLSLNHKKTIIEELPIGSAERWVNQIKDQAVYFERFKPYVDYKEVQSYFDFCISLMSQNSDNSSIVLFALKVLRNHQLTNNAQRLLEKTVVSLSLLYPYIVPLLGEFVFTTYSTPASEIKHFVNMIYRTYMVKNYYEACAFALFYAIKADVMLDDFDVDTVIQRNDCILSLLALVYCRKNKLNTSVKKLKDFAKALKTNDEMDEQWPFVFECLSVGFLAGDWKKLKQAKVSFLNSEFQ